MRLQREEKGLQCEVIDRIAVDKGERRYGPPRQLQYAFLAPYRPFFDAPVHVMEQGNVHNALEISSPDNGRSIIVAL